MTLKSLYYLQTCGMILKLCPRLQAYAPGPYGDYIAPPPPASQIVYSADGQPYAVAYPYQYQGNQWTHYIWPEAFRLQPRDKNSKVLKGSLLSSTTFFFFLLWLFPGGYAAPGVNHVVIQDRQRENGGDVALGMLAGAATGLALGSLFSVF